MKKEITHDEAIVLVTSRLQKEGYTVFSNPSSQKENRIGDCYPDVIACNFKNEVKLIVEVETTESVNSKEIDQWKDYDKLGIPFALCVPKEMADKAKRFCRESNINLFRLFYY